MVIWWWFGGGLVVVLRWFGGGLVVGRWLFKYFLILIVFIDLKIYVYM